VEGFEAHHRFGDFLDKTVVLLDDIVQILDLEYFNHKADPTCQQHQEIDVFKTRIICPAFVYADLVGVICCCRSPA